MDTSSVLQASGATLQWSRPALPESALVVDLASAGGKSVWQFAPDQDVVFINSGTAPIGRLKVDGARNVVVLGLDCRPTTDGSSTLAITGITGNVYIEGVRIDNAAAGESDGISIAGAAGHAPDVTIQNSTVHNVSGSRGGRHGDIFQPWGDLGDLKIANFSGTSNYQGFFLDKFAIGSVELDTVDLGFSPGNEKYATLFWFGNADAGNRFPVTLRDVYTGEQAGMDAESSAVWPRAGADAGTRVNDAIWWDTLPIDGVIRIGTPAGGGFVQPEEVGQDYAHVADALADIAGLHGALVGDNTANQLRGGAGNDLLLGLGGNDSLDGGWGADRLDGGTGADVLTGGDGNDMFIVDNVADVVIEWINVGRGGIDTVTATVSYTLGANVENLLLSGSADLSGTGNHGANRVFGNAGRNDLAGLSGDDVLLGRGGADRLDGGSGMDLLDGGWGSDTLTGGTGADVFRFSFRPAPGNVDVIRDFSAGDRIHLDDFVFAGLSPGALRQASFHLGTTALGDGDRIIYDQASGDLYYDRDGARSGYEQVRFAHIDNHATLTAADFLVI